MLVSSMAIYNYDNNIFDTLVLPEGMERNTLINLILLETAELSVLYSDPATFKWFLGAWSRTRLSVWQHLWDLANEEYDPLDNYNRTDTNTIEHGHTLTMNKTNTSGKTESVIIPEMTQVIITYMVLILIQDKLKTIQF